MSSMEWQEQKYDIVIIGAGIGGLVCASKLCLNGFKVLVIEKNSFMSFGEPSVSQS